MAQYEHLPIYKSAMDVAVYFEKTVKNFSRYHKLNLSSNKRVRYGFPVRLGKVYINMLKRYGKTVTVVGEGDTYFTGVKTRMPTFSLRVEN